MTSPSKPAPRSLCSVRATLAAILATARVPAPVKLIPREEEEEATAGQAAGALPPGAVPAAWPMTACLRPLTLARAAEPRSQDTPAARASEAAARRVLGALLANLGGGPEATDGSSSLGPPQ